MLYRFKDFLINIIKAIKVLFRNITVKLKMVLYDWFSYFQSKKFLFIVILYNAFFISFIIRSFIENNKISIISLVSVPTISILLLIVWYAAELKYWARDKSSTIKIFFSYSTELINILTPVFSFWSTYNFAKLYFEVNSHEYETIFQILLMISMLLIITLYCYELKNIVKMEKQTKYCVKYFLFIIFHIIILFTNVYLLILAFDSNALIEITAQTPVQLCFDIIYFSTMTFIGGDAIITPNTRLSMGVVLIESLIFTIYISTIILNFIMEERDNQNTK